MSEPPTLRVAGAGARALSVSDAARGAADRTRVVETGPTGAPGGPHVYVTADGRTAFHSAVTTATAERLVERCDGGALPTAEADAVIDGKRPPHPDTGPLSVGVRRVLGGCGWHEPDAVPEPVAPDVATDPDDALETVRGVGIRGRGRADVAADERLAPVWERTRDADGEPVVVVHANDADPEADADRLLCLSAAGRVRDAAAAIASIVDATEIIAVVPEADDLVAERLEADAGDRSDDREVEGDEQHWQVVRVDDAFALGEPTMALEALEGNDRIEARRRPPGPEEWGLYGRPTLVHTPRTLLQVAARWRAPDAFDCDAADPGTRLVTVGGDVAERATVELPTDAALSRALAAVDAPADARYVVGGRFGGLASSLDLPADAGTLATAGLGTEGVVEVLGPDRCVVATVGERAAFAREENCGRCVPCREGSIQLHEALRDVYGGEFDADALRELSRVMGATSLCAFGTAAARPVGTAIEEFAAEFRAHADGRCPAGACGGLR